MANIISLYPSGKKPNKDRRRSIAIIFGGDFSYYLTEFGSGSRILHSPDVVQEGVKSSIPKTNEHNNEKSTWLNQTIESVEIKTTCICLNFVNFSTTFYFSFDTFSLLNLLLPPGQLRPTRPQTQATVTAGAFAISACTAHPVGLSSPTAPMLPSPPDSKLLLPLGIGFQPTAPNAVVKSFKISSPQTGLLSCYCLTTPYLYIYTFWSPCF